MPQITDLNKINTAVKQYGPIAKTLIPDLNNPEFAWIDRISNLFDKVNPIIQAYVNNRPQAQAAQLDSTGQAAAVFYQLPPPPPSRDLTAPIQETRIMKMTKFLIPILTVYLDNCIKTNPKMPIGQAIAGLDIIDVSQLKDLLLEYQKGHD